MKTKILLLFGFLILGSMFGQIPTTNLDGEYLFTSGSLLDSYSTNNLTQTGAMLASTTDRYGNTNAINLGGDYLQRNSLQSLTQFSASFWVKTSTNDATLRTILEQSERIDGGTGAAYRGWFASLRNGQITLSGNYRFNYANSSGYTTTGNTGWTTRVSSTNVADGNWHHVVIAVKSRVYFWQQSYWMLEANYIIYVDGVQTVNYLHNKPTYSTNWVNSPAIFPNQPVTVGNNSRGSIVASDVYTDEIDDIRIYKGTLLSSAQVTNLYNEDPCLPKDVSVANVSVNSADVNWSAVAGQSSWDVAYVESGQSISNATILSNVSTNTLGLSSLLSNTAYDVYVRGNCSGSVSDWTNVVTFNTERDPIYVDINASGANDGTSWANAFNSVNDAINIAVASTDKIWVAAGTYVPTSGTGRNAAFSIDKTIEIYGGFNGTETDVSQRDPLTNVTILSGDINGDDSTVITNTETTRQDNSYHVIKLVGSFASGGVIDGFTISGGNANGGSNISCSTSAVNQYLNYRGGAIYVQPNAYNDEIYMEFNNCIIENNSATGMAVYYTLGPCGIQDTLTDIDFINTIIRNNYSVDHSALFYGGSNTYDNFRNGSLVNCLLYNNHCVNDASVLTMSSGGGTTSSKLDVINTTITKNTSGVSQAIRMTNASNSSIRNSIVYDNGSMSSIYISAGTQAAVSNCVIEGGQLSTDASDPLFADALNNDFTIQASSPARDAGNNTYIPSSITTDLGGNQRIFNSMVDLGAYENDDPIPRSLTASATNGTVTVNVQPTNGTYADGAVIELTATPATGYQFNSWSGDATGSANPLNVTMDANKNITATFSLIQQALTTVAVNGTITLDVQPTNGTYDYGNVVQLTATPATGYQFDGWSGDATGSTNPLNVTMNADKAITANFSLIQQTLTTAAVNGSVSRNVSPTNGTYSYGTVVQLTATPATGYQFDGWSGDATGSANPLSITMNADKSVTAIFSLIPTHTLTAVGVNGVVSTNVAPINGTYIDGTVVELTATPAIGYQFDGWSGDATGSTSPLNITMNTDKTITANFSLIQQTLTTVAVNGSVSRSVLPINGTYSYGTVVELTATPATGYQFDGWSGDATGSTNPLIVTMNADKTITANFSLIQQTLTTVAVNGTVSADVQPTNGTYDYGDVVELTATPAAGYQFDGWSGDASGTTSPLSITMDADKSITAIFSLLPQQTLTVVAVNGSVSRNVLPTNGTYDNGEVVELTAIPATGYQFDGWSGDAIGSDNPLRVTMNADKSVIAIFSLIPTYTLTTVGVNGVVSTNVAPTNGTYIDGTVVQLTVTPAIGYQFDGWSGDASGITSPLNVTMSSDKTITANFSVIKHSLTSTANNGTVSVDVQPTNGTYDYGTLIELTATPNAGYQFDGWSGNASGSTNPLSVTMDGDKTITPIFSAVLSVNDVFTKRIKVYPNPVENILNVSLATGEVIKNLEVFTVLGEKVIETNTAIVDFSTITSGVYIVKIETTDGKIAVKKVIKE